MKTTSQCYFNRGVIPKCNLEVAKYLWNVIPKTCEFRAEIQPVFELEAVSPETSLEPSQIVKKDLFPKIVNGFQPVTIFANSFILDVRHLNTSLKSIVNRWVRSHIILHFINSAWSVYIVSILFLISNVT